MMLLTKAGKTEEGPQGMKGGENLSAKLNSKVMAFEGRYARKLNTTRLTSSLLEAEFGEKDWAGEKMGIVMQIKMNEVSGAE